MRTRLALAVCMLAFLLGGCVGHGDVVKLDLEPTPKAATTQAGQPITAVVMPFEDQRSDKTWLGRRQHLFGGETYFTLSGGKPGEVVAQAFADHLRQRGWRASVIKSGEAVAPKAEGGPDVLVTGQIQELSADAVSKFGRTEITVKEKMAVQMKNAQDGSTARLNVDGMRESTVFWFNPEKVEEPFNDLMRENLDRILTDAKGMLQLR